MNAKQLTVIALLGAPFLAIGIYVEANYAPLGNSWWTGVWGILYITGWMASLEVMQRLNLVGSNRFGKRIIPFVLITLLIANISNVWQLVAPTYKPTLFIALDMCWPLSNVLMLAVGAATLKAKRLRGYQRCIPLAVGLWLPLTIAWTLFALAMWRESIRQQRFGSFDEADRVEAIEIFI